MVPDVSTGSSTLGLIELPLRPRPPRRAHRPPHRRRLGHGRRPRPRPRPRGHLHPARPAPGPPRRPPHPGTRRQAATAARVALPRAHRARRPLPHRRRVGRGRPPRRSRHGHRPRRRRQGCRWIAVRHADDHIHIMATTVRADGRRPRTNRDGWRAQPNAARSRTSSGCAASSPATSPPHDPDRRRAGQGRTPGPDGDRTGVAARAGVRGRRRRTQRATSTSPCCGSLGIQVKHAHRPRDRRGDRLQPRRARRHQRPRRAGLVRRLEARPRPVHQPAPRTPSHPGPGRPPSAGGGPGRTVASRRNRRPRQPTPSSTQATTPRPRATWLPSATPLHNLALATTAGHRAELQAAARAFNRARRSAIQRRPPGGHRPARSRQGTRLRLTRAGRIRRSPDLRRRSTLARAAAKWHEQRGHEQQAAAAEEAFRHLQRRLPAGRPARLGGSRPPRTTRRNRQPLRGRICAQSSPTTPTASSPTPPGRP